MNVINELFKTDSTVYYAISNEDTSLEEVLENNKDSIISVIEVCLCAIKEQELNINAHKAFLKEALEAAETKLKRIDNEKQQVINQLQKYAITEFNSEHLGLVKLAKAGGKQALNI